MTSFISSISTNSRRKTPEQLVSLCRQSLASLALAVETQTNTHSQPHTHTHTHALAQRTRSHSAGSSSSLGFAPAVLSTVSTDTHTDTHTETHREIHTEREGESARTQTQTQTNSRALSPSPSPSVCVSAGGSTHTHTPTFSAPPSPQTLSEKEREREKERETHTLRVSALPALARARTHTHTHSHSHAEDLSLSLTRTLAEMKNCLYGDVDHPVVDEEKATELSRALQQTHSPSHTQTQTQSNTQQSHTQTHTQTQSNTQSQSTEPLVPALLTHLSLLSLDARNDVTLIFHYLMTHNVHSFAHSFTQTDLSLCLPHLLRGYAHGEIALQCGLILRDCLAHSAAVRFILLEHTHLLWPFFEQYVHSPAFDVASDAFFSLQSIFLGPSAANMMIARNAQEESAAQANELERKAIVADFLEKHRDLFLQKFDILLQSESYVTRRFSLKLLSELLLDRAHYSLMIQFISNKENLKTVMNLLRHKSPHIQLETFHLFKIFVANPHKPVDVARILFINRDKLVAYLEAFHNHELDAQFVEEKRLLIETLQTMSESDCEPPVERRRTRTESGSLVNV